MGKCLCCKYLNKENEFQSEILKTNENAKILKTENCNAENKNDANKYLENIKNDALIKLGTSVHRILQNKDFKHINLADHSITLTLKVINPENTNFLLRMLKINALGLIDSKRIPKDGCVYFGINKEETNNESNEIDVNIPLKFSDMVDEKSLGRHFQIEFKIDNYNYCIRDLGIGFGTFAKLDFPLILKDKHLIHIGDSYIVVNIIDNNQTTFSVDSSNNKELNNLQLSLKIFGVSNKGECYIFPNSKSKIMIGRYQMCDLEIMDKLLSKYHCSIIYDNKDGWTLYDGTDFIHPSTNGTWLFVNEDFEIYDNLIFKSNQTVFQCFLSQE